jgi:hypothetical protein
MRCKDFQRIASQFLDRQLDEPEREAYVIHVQECGSCARHLEETRAVTRGLRGLQAPEAPDGLLAAAMLKIDREGARGLTIGTPSRLMAPLGALAGLIDRFELKLIAYSVGLVVSACLFATVLAAMRPLMSVAPFVAPGQIIWVTPLEAEAMGDAALTARHTIPRFSEDGAFPMLTWLPELGSNDDVFVLAEVAPDGRASIVRVLSSSVDGRGLSRLERAINQPEAFVPSQAASGRIVASRVVLFFQAVEVVG